MNDDANDTKGARAASRRPKLPHIDVFETGALVDGIQQRMNRRVFFQLWVFDVPAAGDVTEAARALEAALIDAGLGGVVYDDVSAPRGLGLLAFTENPVDIVALRTSFTAAPLSGLVFRHEFTMFGRTYAGGYERDLEQWIIDRPKQTVLNEAWPWAIWYPLRRTGAFQDLEGPHKGRVIGEHATIGRAYGEQDLAHDVRLACHGLDQNDNEFVLGIIGRDLHPLSHVVEAMRSTEQTSRYIEKMGPFFVGRARARVAERSG